MNLIYDILLDTGMDILKMTPFLFITFVLTEALEQYSTKFIDIFLIKISKAGPLIGALLGCIPQCGFSIMTANLFSNGIVSLGTLLSVFLSSSDEAVLILLGHSEQASIILRLCVIKVIFAVIIGYIVDFYFSKHMIKEIFIRLPYNHCNKHRHHGITKSAICHTLKMCLYLFLFSGILNLLTKAVNIHTVSAFLLKGSILQPFFTALLGFIPNCAISVLLIELYLIQSITFPSLIAGLFTNTGLGLVVLFKTNKNIKIKIFVTVVLYLTSIVAGILSYYIF